MGGDRRRRGRRAARLWQALLAVYAAALLVATHWPRLELGSQSSPAPDKLLHLFAFGGLTVLLERSRLVRAPAAVLIAAVWAALGELTQALPGLGRTTNPEDLAAGELGVLLVGAWWWALRPRNGAVGRLRRAWRPFIAEDLFSGPRGWLVVGAGGALGAATAGGAGWIALRASSMAADLPTWVLAIACMGASASAFATLAGLLRRRAAELAERRPCLACGAAVAPADLDEAGRGRCRRCGAAAHAGQWLPLAERPQAREVAIGLAAALGSLLVYWVVGTLILLLSIRVGPAKSALRLWNDLSLDLQLGVDLTAVGLSAAIGVAVYRRRRARREQRQHVRCRRCGHDLTAAPRRGGVGRCGECGTPFLPQEARDDLAAALRGEV